MSRYIPAINLFSLLLICALGVGAYYMEVLNTKRFEVESRLALQSHLFDIRNRIENNLISDMQLAKGLIAAVATNPGIEQASFEKAASALFQNHTQLLSVSAAPGMVIELLYPLEGNEAAVGLNLRNVPEQYVAAERARDTGKIVLSGPVKLVEGGSALIARMPVYLKDRSGRPYFWGLVSALIDEQGLYHSSQLDDSPVEVAIRGRHATGAQGEVFYGRPGLFDENPALTEIRLPVGSWQLAVLAKEPLLDPVSFLWPMRVGYAIASMIILLAFFVLRHALRVTSAAQINAEAAQSKLRESLKTLHDRENLLRTVIDEMPDVMVLKDREGNFLLGNAAVAKLYNTSPEEMEGKHDGDFGVPQEMADIFRENVIKIMQKGEAEVVLEQSTDIRSGEIRHYKSIKKPFKDSDGNDQILVLAHDITDILQAQTQLEESESKLSTILDNVDAYIYLKDREGKYLFANRAVRELWQVEMPDIVGFGDSKFFDTETAEIIVKNDRLVIERGQMLKTEEVNTLPNGTTTTYQSTKLPLLNEEGAVYALCGISVDITEIKRIEKALRESEQRFKMAGRAAYDLIYEWDVVTDSLCWFGDVDNMLGYPKGEISHDIQAWLHLIHPEDVAVLADAVDLHRESTQPIRYEYRIRHQNGKYLYWSDHALPLLNEAGEPYKWIGVCTDITTQKEQQNQLEFSAYHDKLTNLPNRVLLADRLSQAMHQVRRRELKLAVAYIDLDGFKEINDQYGHEVGDHLLIAIGQRFQTLLREGDTIARLGGDEFVAVMIDMEGSVDLIPLLRRILHSVSQPVEVGGLKLQVSASLGVTFYPQTEEVDGDKLLRQADQAMYQAKLEGKNRYFFFDTEQDRSLRGQRENLERVASALSEGEFELYYQPKVNMKSGDIVGMEALIRWNHPEEGVLLPGQFLPLVEDKPVAVQIGEWVIRAALQQIRRWQDLGQDIPVSVNIGGLQLQQANFVDRLGSILSEFPEVAPKMLELEVLESSALQDITIVSRVMKQCQALGVTFSLDDFGTGYSSLTYLKYLPAELLKIDRSFVRDMLEDPDDLAILESVVGMSTAFRRGVIAEGVEEIAHGELLIQLGCNLAQGYAIAKPMPASDVLDWVRGWNPPVEWQQKRLVSRDNISLLFAEIEHRAWVKQVEDYLGDSLLEWPEYDITKCRFGEWLSNEGRNKYGYSALFPEIESLHEQIHLCGEMACKAKLSNQVERSEESLREMHRNSHALLEKLQLLLDAVS